MSFFSKKTPDSLEELVAKVSSNDKISWNTKSQVDLRVKLWNLSLKEADDLLLEMSTPIEKLTTSSLNAMPNTNFQAISSRFVQNANRLLTTIPKEKIELLTAVSGLNKHYPGIYEKMQTLLTDKSRGILDSLRSKLKIFQNANIRRTRKKGQAAANSLQTRLNAIRRQGGRRGRGSGKGRKTLRRRNP